MRTEMRLTCPMCFSNTKALIGDQPPRSGDIVMCGCGAVNIYDAKRRPRVLRRPTAAELVLIGTNESYQRLVARKANRGLQ